MYALKTDKLDLPPDASAAMLGFMTNANKLGSATFTVKYSRPKAKAAPAEKPAAEPKK